MSEDKNGLTEGVMIDRRVIYRRVTDVDTVVVGKMTKLKVCDDVME